MGVVSAVALQPSFTFTSLLMLALLILSWVLLSCGFADEFGVCVAPLVLPSPHSYRRVALQLLT
jgi:hypothetical protein